MQHLKETAGREFVIVSDAQEDQAGATVWWRLRGDADRLHLVAALAARGIDHAPPAHAPEVALRRAVAVLRGKRRLVRPLRRGSWAVVEEELDDLNERLKHWTGPTVSLDKIGRAVLKNASAEEAQQVKDAYEYHLDALTTEDVSSWLTAQVERLGAVGLREGGGIYYVPPARMPEWRQLMAALGEAAPKHSVYVVPTVRVTADGARAILDSLTAEVQAEVDRVTNEIVGGDLGVRALETRAEASHDMLRKVGSYEEVLGGRLDRLRETIAELSSRVVAAKLAAEAAREEAS